MIDLNEISREFERTYNSHRGSFKVHLFIDRIECLEYYKYYAYWLLISIAGKSTIYWILSVEQIFRYKFNVA